ncbi:hypothetical protein OA857_02815 [Alphaproteobacteria bacterium]|nr:hypothetical protein [Alphaproteobacteria bacterium]
MELTEILLSGIIIVLVISLLSISSHLTSIYRAICLINDNMINSPNRETLGEIRDNIEKLKEEVQESNGKLTLICRYTEKPLEKYPGSPLVEYE